jgi:hypothetical protein
MKATLIKLRPQLHQSARRRVESEFLNPDIHTTRAEMSNAKKLTLTMSSARTKPPHKTFARRADGLSLWSGNKLSLIHNGGLQIPGAFATSATKNGIAPRINVSLGRRGFQDQSDFSFPILDSA